MFRIKEEILESVKHLSEKKSFFLSFSMYTYKAIGLSRNQFISLKSVKFCFKGSRLNDRKYKNTHDILMLQLISCVAEKC